MHRRNPCRGCGELYPITEEYYHRSARYITGFNTARCKPCGNAAKLASYNKHRTTVLIKTRAYRSKTRLDVLAYYSGGVPQCSCCGVTEPQFLALDHKNGGGNAHRKAIKAEMGNNIFLWVKRNNYPVGFQVLCHNCNMARGFYGKCPHEEER